MVADYILRDVAARNTSVIPKCHNPYVRYLAREQRLDLYILRVSTLPRVELVAYKVVNEDDAIEFSLLIVYLTIDWMLK